MFWKKATAPAPPESASDPSSGDDAALDAVTSLLKAFGENAFDTDNVSARETRTECEGWAQKLSLGSGRGDDDEHSDGPKPFRRDFAGMRRFFSAQSWFGRRPMTRKPSIK